MSKKPAGIVRLAERKDLDAILLVDDSRYGEVSAETTASRHAMLNRIIVENEHGSGWFWVFEENGRITGIFSMMPTNKPHEEFTSWHDCSDNGTLQTTFHEHGAYIYVVALTTAKDAHKSAVDELLARGWGKFVKSGRQLAYFGSRMPFYNTPTMEWANADKYPSRIIHLNGQFKHVCGANDATIVLPDDVVYGRKPASAFLTPEQYYEARIQVGPTTYKNEAEWKRRTKWRALDPQIRMYEGMGLKRIRLVPGGFRGDVESAEFAVLFLVKNPFASLPGRKIWGALMQWLIRHADTIDRVVGKFF